MATYSGQVVDNVDTEPQFPFIAIVSDDAGKVVGSFPMRTYANAQAKIAEVMSGLNALAFVQEAGEDDTDA